MSHGKGGKGIGKSAGKGSTAKRHQGMQISPLAGIRSPAIKRLARKAGVKRISSTIYRRVRDDLSSMLNDILVVAIEYPKMRKQKTITAVDIVHALQQCNMPLLI